MQKCEWCGKPLDADNPYQHEKGVCNEDCYSELRYNESRGSQLANYRS